MRQGLYISGGGHLGVLLWILGAGLISVPDAEKPFSVTEVSIMSAEAFAALTSSSPEAIPDVVLPRAPELVVEQTATGAPDTAPDIAPADAPEMPQDAGNAPDLTDIRSPVTTDVTIEAPEVTPPNADTATAVLLPPSPEAPSATPGPRRPDPARNQTPAPLPAQRVDLVPQVRPDPDRRTAEDESRATAPSPDATQAAHAAQDAAKEEATRQIVPAEREVAGTGAPQVAPRPRPRPARAASPAPAESDAERIAAAVAAAAAGSATQSAKTPDPTLPTGPALTSAEEDGLRFAVQKCWNLGSLSTDAMRVTVVVGLEMTEDAKPVADTIRLISFTDGTEGAALQAYEAARRAIIRCGAQGYDLPAEKFAHWRDIEMTFNPEKMRLR